MRLGMKKILISSVALLGLTAGAMAADVPSRTITPVAPVVPAPAPVFTWTGFYVGVNAGYGFSDRNNNECFGGCGIGGLAVPTLTADFSLGPPAPVVPAAGFPVGFGGFNGNRRNHNGFVGGGQIGYNYQFTPGSGVVIGMEVDLQYADFGRRRNDFFSSGGFDSNIFTANPVFPAGTFLPNGPSFGILPPIASSAGNVVLFDNAFGNSFGRNRIDWFGTVRGRLGYAVDRLLIYVTGGAAFTDRSDRCFDGGVFNGGFGCGSGGFVSGAAVPASFFESEIAAAVGANVSATRSFFSNGHVRRDNDFGWTIGGGVEYAFTDNLTVKLEGLYVNFYSNHRDNFLSLDNDVVGVTNTGAAVTSTGLSFSDFRFDNRRHDDFAVVRAGLNYKFTAN
jgi:outer membrane immunogenic protein